MSKKIPTYTLGTFTQHANIDPFKIALFNRENHTQVEYPHRHDSFYEILLIAKGSGTYKIDFTEYPIVPMSIFFVSPGQIHEINYTNDTEGIIFLFNSEFYDVNAPDQNRILNLPFFYSLKDNQSSLLLCEKDFSKLLSLMSWALEDFENKTFGYRETILSYLELILNYCKRSYATHNELMPKKGILLTKKFKQLIEENFSKNLSVRDYAEILNVTPNHLNEMVKEFTGKNANALIDEKTILEVKRMLVYTPMNITQIATSLNFSDQSYFSKYVKKLTGQTPLQIREKK